MEKISVKEIMQKLQSGDAIDCVAEHVALTCDIHLVRRNQSDEECTIMLTFGTIRPEAVDVPVSAELLPDNSDATDIPVEEIPCILRGLGVHLNSKIWEEKSQ